MVRINLKETGKLIESKCVEQGYKAKQLSEILDVQITSPYAWFNGKVMPQFDTFVKLCSLLKCSMEDLIVFETDEDTEYIPTADWRNSTELKEMLAEGASLTYNTDSDEFMIGADNNPTAEEEVSEDE